MSKASGKAGGILGLSVALLLLASAYAHGALGWPAIQETLAGTSVGPDVVGALAVGWYFGSASMLAFGLIVLLQTSRLLKRDRPDAGSLWVIAAIYLLFGTVAYVTRDFNSHFLLFIGTGGGRRCLRGPVPQRHGQVRILDSE